MIRPYPISIEWPPKALAGQPPIENLPRRCAQALGLPPDAKLGRRHRAVRLHQGHPRPDARRSTLLLIRQPEWKGRFTFVQVAAPTRSKLPSYSKLQAEAVALAEEINARHGDGGYRPIRLLIRHHEPAEVFELFRAADLCIVTSLHDGMNLVAKEFVAARDDEQGVLVLSSFTGASREMSEALIVNPYDDAGDGATRSTRRCACRSRSSGADATDAPAGPRTERLSLGRPHADRRRRHPPAATHIRDQREQAQT